MDELLKRHAKELREKSGADFELHPVTRKIFQDEAARSLAKKETRPKVFFWLWPRLAFVGVFTALLVVALLQLNTPKNSRARMELAKEFPKDNSTTPAQPKLAEELKSFSAVSPAVSVPAKSEARAPATVDLAKLQDFRAVGGAQLANREEETLHRPAERNSPDGKLDELADKKPSRSIGVSRAVTNSVADRDSTVAASPAPVPASEAAFYADGQSPARWKFAQQDSRDRYRRNFLSPPSPKIFVSFELARTENKIRLIESDGSVYEGEILNPAKDISGANDLKNKTEPGFAFHVAGINRQLNRRVNFTGNFSPASDTLAKAKAPAAAAGELKKQTVQRNGSIIGKVSIGGTNEFEIQAVEVTP